MKKTFKEKAIAVHRDEYNYDKTSYKNAIDKVIITCKKHGDFTQRPSNHLTGHGCPVCAKEKKVERARIEGEKLFYEEVKEKHGATYDYSLTKYVKNKEKVKILCKKHGVFEQTPALHKKGSGCMECHKENVKVTLEDFKERSNNLHNNKFDYRHVDFKLTKDKVRIICPVHGEFLQEVGTHLKGSDCKKCTDSNRSPKKRQSTQDFIIKCSEIHEDKYDYSHTIYRSMVEKIKIICPKHEMFEQTANNHRQGLGCTKCGAERNSEHRKDTQEEYLTKCKKIYGDIYDYSKVEYKKSKSNVTIICGEHGVFTMKAGNHLQGRGCPKCGLSKNTSKPEEELAEFIKSFLEIEQSNRIILGTKELDIYAPSKKVAIEFNGLYWHSDKFKDSKYHLEKTIECNKKGVKLIHIFEDEWNYKKEQVKSRVKNILGASETKIYARKTEIREAPTKEAMQFLEENHLQGRLGGKVKLGLYYNNELVSLMTFGKLRKNLGSTHKEGHYELLRFCNKLDTSVIGGFSKLLKHFKRTVEYKSLISYADRRWSEGNVYKVNGFSKVSESVPNYFYTKGYIREARFKYRKDILASEGYDKNKTEREIMRDRGYNRVYDCGTLKYEMT